MNEWAVQVEGLGRVYRPAKKPEVVALSELDLSVRQGEVHGLLGPNGAGKTTLVKILSTILAPTSGRARVLGHDVAVAADHVRPLVGIVFGGDRGLYPRLSARHNLHYFAALYGLSRQEASARTDHLLDRVGLAARVDDRVESYSRGMKQRLHLARGLVSDPQVVFLDEPTVGMDPAAALEFRGLVSELVDEGRTVFLTTHDMAEAESVCDRVSVIDRGRLLATETPQALRNRAAQRRVDIEGADAALVERLAKGEGVFEASLVGEGRAQVRLASAEHVPALLRLLADGGVTGVEVAPPRLEEVYLDLIGPRGLEV